MKFLVETNWDTAFYSREILECLGLTRDHNEKVQKAAEESGGRND
jgi:hypothetical protein